MLNDLRPWVARIVDPIGRLLARLGLSADAVTIVGSLGVAAAALVFYPRGWLFVGTLVVTAFVLFDMLDGAVARARNTRSPWGAFLDSTMDRFGDAAILCGLLLWLTGAGEDRLLTGVALGCLVASFLIPYVKARAEALGAGCDVGIAERTVRLIILLTAIGLHGLDVPYILAAGLWLLAVLSVITIAQRMLETRNRLAEQRRRTTQT